ncbi:MAG: isoaspartyl peptidase/L-asparaginase [Sphingobacteriales bacterium]|nr:isoaspartyl peptidase/L-asparaginase [Sphingobacteriales bacterium]MBI3719626.1 isoaspartyl peptidase/L-asparaginase [Sphingobacteriales bacterium]
MNKFSIAIHGGAGTILQSLMTPELEKAYKDGLQNALDAGYAVLKNNGSAIDAVLTATVELENNILFNAGRGSVFTNKGLHEMDAAIMSGIDLSAGAVTGVTKVKNPVELAYRVMTNSNHVLLCGNGADEFAKEQQVQSENDDYFFSEFRYKQWLEIRESDGYALDHSVTEAGEKKFGTVGAVACDMFGNIAAATSTGGMTNKKYGRVGDSPLIGCGTYANNKTCAISATGHGELFIKAVAAYDVSCLMEYKELSLQEAMNMVVNDKLVKINGEGGMIGVDTKANIAMLFNCEGMYRGMRNGEGMNEVAIYK